MVGIDRKAHWQGIYSSKSEAGVSWYQSEARLSFELIKAVAPTAHGRIIDMGGGASILVDRLLDLSLDSVAVLDISEAAMAKARARLGVRAYLVRWIVADVTEGDEIGTFDVLA